MKQYLKRAKQFARRIERSMSPTKDVVAQAQRLYTDGRYSEAYDYLAQVIAGDHAWTSDLAITFAQVCKSISKYDQARNALATARSSLPHKMRALIMEAEIAWLQHRYDEGLELSLTALQLDPSNRRAQSLRDRCKHPATTLPVEGASESAPTFAHAAFYVTRNGNFGDVSLPLAVREAVASVQEVKAWLPIHVHQQFDDAQVERVNTTDGLIVGGGGLFLPDTSPNGVSGWQWNVADDQLERIEVPLAIYAVGYNLFEGQQFRGDLFQRSLNAVVNRAKLIGLRNMGSVQRVQDLLPPNLADKVQYLPCPTTVLRHIHQGAQPGNGESGQVLINAAFDRKELRFKDDYQSFLRNMADYIRNLRERSIDVAFVAHLERDEVFVHDIRSEHGIKLPINALYDMPVEDGYRLYERAALVVGMRGHATMIPFGLGTPVVSLISHPKMRYFLQDIRRDEWGFEVADTKLGATLTEFTLDVLDRQSEYRKDVAEIQLGLLNTIQTASKQFTG